MTHTLFGINVHTNWMIVKGIMVKYDKNAMNNTLEGEANNFPNEVIEMHPEDYVFFLSSMGLYNEALNALKENVYYKINNRMYG